MEMTTLLPELLSHYATGTSTSALDGSYSSPDNRRPESMLPTDMFSKEGTLLAHGVVLSETEHSRVVRVSNNEGVPFAIKTAWSTSSESMDLDGLVDGLRNAGCKISPRLYDAPENRQVCFMLVTGLRK